MQVEGMVDAKGPQLKTHMERGLCQLADNPSRARRPLLWYVPRGKRADGRQEKGSSKNVSWLLLD